MKKVLALAAAAALMAPMAANAERTGEEVVNTKCSTCHVPGVAGAPKIGDAAAWAPRAEQGIDTLVQHAINGKGAMPPKGLCMDCSDAEIHAAVEYMLEKSK